MANNRMYLRVKDNPGQEILLCKYYPGTGWYIFYNIKTLNTWLNKYLNHNDLSNPDWVDGQWGRTNLELAFETNSEEKEVIRQNLKKEKVFRAD